MRFKLISLSLAATALIVLSGCATNGADSYSGNNVRGHYPGDHPNPKDAQVFTETASKEQQQNKAGAYAGVSAGAGRS